PCPRGEAGRRYGMSRHFGPDGFLKRGVRASAAVRKAMNMPAVRDPKPPGHGDIPPPLAQWELAARGRRRDILTPAPKAATCASAWRDRDSYAQQARKGTHRPTAPRRR